MKVIETTSVQAIAEFCIWNSEGIYTLNAFDKLVEAIELHIKYNTLLVLTDHDGISVLCRWNLSQDGEIATIIDFIIKKEYRNRKIIRNVLLYGLTMFPGVKYLAYDKFKGGNIVRKSLHSVDKLLKRRI